MVHSTNSLEPSVIPNCSFAVVVPVVHKCVCGNENLVKLWADKLQEPVTFSNPNASRLLAQALVDLEVSVEDMASADSVSAALNKLKHKEDP